MSNTSQKRALKNYRKRLDERGMARFEVLGLNADRELIRSLARRLAENGPDATRMRATLRRTISGDPPKKGGILAALRRSPMVGADLDVSRSLTPGRKVALRRAISLTRISSAMSPSLSPQRHSSPGWPNGRTLTCSSRP